MYLPWSNIVFVMYLPWSTTLYLTQSNATFVKYLPRSYDVFAFWQHCIWLNPMLHSLCICTDLVMYLPQSSFLLSPRGNTQQAKFGPGEGGEKKSEGQKSSSRSKKRGEWARKWAKNNCVIFDTPTPRPPWDVFNCPSSSIPTYQADHLVYSEGSARQCVHLVK